MRSVEATGRTKEEATQTALEELGAELHEVQTEILDVGSRGIFGFGARDWKVRVTLDVPEEEARKSRRPEGRGRPGKPKAQQGAPRRAQAPKAKTAPAERARAPQSRAPQAEVTPMTEDERNEAAALLGEVVAKMGMKATIEVAPTEEGGVRLNIKSEDSAIIIGRRGRNREALQFLINRMFIGGDMPTTRDRISVDVEDYVVRRCQSLEEMARNMARQVKDEGRKMRLKPLNPQERRIVHLALQDDPDVRTFSVGDSENRSVVIAPRDGRDDERGRQRSRPPRRRRGPRPRQAPGDADTPTRQTQAESRGESGQGESQES